MLNIIPGFLLPPAYEVRREVMFLRMSVNRVGDIHGLWSFPGEGVPHGSVTGPVKRPVWGVPWGPAQSTVLVPPGEGVPHGAVTGSVQSPAQRGGVG